MSEQQAPDRLTPRQQEILRYIIEQTVADGGPPSYRDVAARFGMRGASGALSQLTVLATKGLLIVPTSRRRAVRVPGLKLQAGFTDDAQGRGLRAFLAADLTVACDECKARFSPASSQQRYCSRKCRARTLGRRPYRRKAA